MNPWAAHNCHTCGVGTEVPQIGDARDPHKGWYQFSLFPFTTGDVGGPKNQTTGAALCPDCARRVGAFVDELERETRPRA
jgi:hypothetical protein